MKQPIIHKSSFFVLATSALLFLQIIMPFGAQAQSVGVGGSAGNMMATSNAVVFDGNHMNDDLVQFNKFRIESISSPTLPSVIMAYADFGLNCIKFNERNEHFPCLKIVSRQYQIRVTAETILLLKNRVRATFADFAVGDLINVYGFKDPTMDGIDALVMRNVDKPRTQKYIQFNSAEVVVVPSSNTFPAQIGVIRSPAFPCYDYGNGNEARQDIACPLGIESASRKEALMGGSMVAKNLLDRPITGDVFLIRKYLVNITPQTILLKRDRTPATLGDIAVGDKVNIYGILQNDGSIEARIVRDLSRSVAHTFAPSSGQNSTGYSFVPSISSSSTVSTTITPTTTIIASSTADVRADITSGVTVYVHIGPTCSVEQYTTSFNCADKPYIKAVVVATSGVKGDQYKGETGEDGNVTMIMPMGTYTISVPASSRSTPRCGSKEVVVRASGFTSVDISCDSGIR